jgi:phosphatidylglycerol:prolipoprotein diacylglycerol transferase
VLPAAYPLVMAAAVAAGWLIARRTQAAVDLTPPQRWAIALGAFCGGMIGARLPYVLVDWDAFVSGSGWLHGGKTILTGLAGGYFGVELAKWATHVNVKTGDGFAVPVAVAVGIGRLGCLVGGCCCGTPTELPWGMNFGDGALRHPTQLYEAAFHFALAGLLAILQARGLLPMQRIKLYILSYLVYRFVTEFIRPEDQWALGLTVYQWAAIALTPVFTALWWYDAGLVRRSNVRGDAPAGASRPDSSERG